MDTSVSRQPKQTKVHDVWRITGSRRFSEFTSVGNQLIKTDFLNFHKNILCDVCSASPLENKCGDGQGFMPPLLNLGTCVSFTKRMLRFLSGAESLPVFLAQHGIANLFMLLNIGNFSLDFTDQLKQRPGLLVTEECD